MNAYSPRVVDAEIADRLRSHGAVLIEGPKACGKTMAARQVACSEILFDVDQSARDVARVDASILLDGKEAPLLLDEWQLAPSVWNEVRRQIDSSGATGQFILAGSSAAVDAALHHSGTGRIARVAMRPMSLFEVGDSSGDISLKALMGGAPARATDRPGGDVRSVAGAIARGGWPGFRALDDEAAAAAVASYVREVTRADISDLDGRTRDPSKVMRLLRSLARHTGSDVAAATLAKDMTRDGESAHRDTVRDYLRALRDLRVFEDLEAWAPHLRSRARVRTTPKVHFVDPSIAAGALGANGAALLADLRLFGHLFESLVVRDLRIYSQALGGRVLHFTDGESMEFDAVVELPDGAWGAFEVKLALTDVDEAAAKLLSTVEQIDTSVCGKPSTIAVVTPSGYGYRREDGVDVVPIWALGP